MLLYGRDQAVAWWVAERIDHVNGDFGPCAAIGVLRRTGGEIIAGMVYHDYQEPFGTMQLSMPAESPMWARRENIRGLLSYPFDQLGVYKVWTMTPADNEPALKVNRHVGFTQEAVLAHQFGRNRHGVVCRLLKPDFDRLYGERAHGQE